MLKPYYAIFKEKGSDPSPYMEVHWLSFSLKANSDEEAARMVKWEMDKLQPLLKKKYVLVVIEDYNLRPEMAGPYRGVRLNIV